MRRAKFAHGCWLIPIFGIWSERWQSVLFHCTEDADAATPSSAQVTRRLLTMSFLDGVQITRMGEFTSGFSEFKKQAAARRILSHVSEAYGRMLLYDGLFQADGHPGNILVRKGGC